MCLIAFAWQRHPRWRLLLAGNRDEFHARPTAALDRWDGAPILGGRDLQAGGTWLGVAAGGRCAAVTNVRDPGAPQEGESRGHLAADYLAGGAAAAAHADALVQTAVVYRPFNLLVFDAQAAFCLGNRPAPRVQAVATGVHGLSNAALDTPWPKTLTLMHRMECWLQGDEENFAPLFEALADEHAAADAELPDTGIGIERERDLSAAFIRGTTYGTRASSVVAVGHDGRGVIIERRFGPGGVFLGQSSLAF